VAADPLGQIDGGGRGPSLEKLFDAFVDEPQPGLEVEDCLADHRKAEMPGLDEPGVHRTNGNLVDARSLDRTERIRAVGVAEARSGPGVTPHRVPALWPVEVADESAGEWVVVDVDAV